MKEQTKDLTTKSRAGKLTKFDPAAIKENTAKLDAIIKYAQTVKNWPLLEQAVDEKIDQQGQFVGWWEQILTVDHGAGRGHKKVSDLKSFSMEKVEESTGISKVKVSRWRKGLADIPRYREKILLAGYRGAELQSAANHRGEGTGENEWYTPPQYIKAARRVLGGIDLDPASSDFGQKTIGARSFFTKADNGLLKKWHGRVWLNPPYSQPLIRQFIEKLVEEFSKGHISQAILLTHSYTDTAWFHLGESKAALICFTRGRIKFADKDGEECAPTQGQAFFYYGKNVKGFRDVFKDFGFIR